ncbi:unnamed protein product [Mytilus coruscus]|uniref:Uncharacterized protein n=1 Tax=Mytilus coruscus TaxID=42192 RepID=A0A6J8CF21_MYTCO|nr:unnamed protein product [Mytilus coruscus]
MSEGNQSRENNCSSSNFCLDGTAMVRSIAGNVNSTPILLPKFPRLLQSHQGEPHPMIQNKSPQLVGWLVSGDHIKQCQYQRRLKNFCSAPGGREPRNLTIRPGISDLFSAPLTAVLDFLAWMFQKGFQYRTVNVHRSALSSILPHIDGQPVGQTQLVKN